MASSMQTQILEQLSILDEALLQPDKFVGLKLAVGSEIPGFGHDTRVSEVTDEKSSLVAFRQSTRPVSRFRVARFDTSAQTAWYARYVLFRSLNVSDGRARGRRGGHPGPDRRHLAR